MTKLVLNNITSGFSSTTATNANNDLVEAAIENTLSRDGTSPNQMLSNLDMNGYAILNQRATSGNENFIWLGTWVTGTTYAVNNLVYAPEGTNEGATLICVTAHTAGATLNGDAAKWAVFAQRGASGAGTGDVIGPASSTADSLARFNGTTGKLLKDGAVIGTDVQAYNANLQALTAFTTSTDVALGTSDIILPTQKAIKTYTDTKVATVSPRFGVGQTWSDLTASRSIGTLYTNNTTMPIYVQVSISCVSANYSGISVSGVVIGKTGSAGDYQVLTAVVPVGATYSVSHLTGSANTIVIWAELQ